MEEVSTKTQMAKIRNFEKGFMATHLINLGAKLGIFEILNENKKGLTVPEMASRLGLHEPYLKIWCQTAYNFEILDGDEQGRFMLQPFLNEILGDKNHFRSYLAQYRHGCRNHRQRHVRNGGVLSQRKCYRKLSLT